MFGLIKLLARSVEAMERIAEGVERIAECLEGVQDEPQFVVLSGESDAANRS